MPPPPPRPPRRWWLVAAFLAVLALPAPWLGAAFVLAASGQLAVHIWHRVRARRLHRESWRNAGADAIVLGAEPSGRGVLLGDQELAAHGLILGASGAGKTTTLLTILTAQIARGRPVVAVDLKGSPTFARQLAYAAREAGRPCRIWTPDGPEQWNPLADGNPTELKDKLIATERFTEPHYQRAAERYVQTALQVIQAAHPDRSVTLPEVVEMMDPVRLGVLARVLVPERADHVRDYLSALTRDQLSAVRGLASRLAIISESHTGEFLTGDGGRGIDLRSALAGDEVVVFSLNSSTYGQLSAQLGTLVIQDLVTAAGHRVSVGPIGPAIVGIDEFSALGSDNLLSLFARGREAGVSVVLATQELADLDRAGRGLRDQVVGNTAVKIAHRQDVPESAATVARLAGTEHVWERSYQLRPGWLGGVDMRHGSLRLVDRYVIDPEKVRTLGTGEAVVIVKTPRSSARLTHVRPPTVRDSPER